MVDLLLMLSASILQRFGAKVQQIQNTGKPRLYVSDFAVGFCHHAVLPYANTHPDFPLVSTVDLSLKILLFGGAIFPIGAMLEMRAILIFSGFCAIGYSHFCG